MEQMESSIDQLSKRCGFPVVLDRIQVLNTIGNRVEKLDRMLNEKIEQLQQLTQERDSANEQATLSANHAKHHQQRLHEAYETMVIHSKNYETNKEKLMEEIKDLEMRMAGERARVVELTRERDEAWLILRRKLQVNTLLDIVECANRIVSDLNHSENENSILTERVKDESAQCVSYHGEITKLRSRAEAAEKKLAEVEAELNLWKAAFLAGQQSK